MDARDAALFTLASLAIIAALQWAQALISHSAQMNPVAVFIGLFVGGWLWGLGTSLFGADPDGAQDDWPTGLRGWNRSAPRLGD